MTRRFDRIDLFCARRMQEGTPKYGCLDLANDTRDYFEEAKEEIADAINYIKWAVARGDMPKWKGQAIINNLKGIFVTLTIL